ncbi:MAG: hypothetical protein IKX58_04685 [Clostridia bacterium]|nr:hypothetical protein [Clostridia bacterium]
MKCPFCGNEMLKGYVQSRDGLCWAEKKTAITAFHRLRGSSVQLAEPDESPFVGCVAVAYNCPDCKKVVIGYAPEDRE